MRNSLNRALSLVLAVLMLGSVAVISASANEGAKERHTLQQAMDEYWTEEYDGETIPLTTYYFYMPDEWRNKYNDYYDGSDLSSCMAGVYWFGSSLCLPADYPFHDNDWPGYAVTEKDTEDVFVARVPYDVHTILFNNLVDGGTDKTLEVYEQAYQIGNTPTNYDGADKYGFYPNGLESTENMIYVVNPEATGVNEYTGKTTFGGAWFYYYGNGEYGIAPTKEEADTVYKDGEFPSSKLIVKPEKNEGIGVGTSIELNPSKTPVTYVSDNEAVAVVETTEDGKYILKAVGEGNAAITFTYFDATTEEEETATVTINVVAPSLNKDSLTLKVGDLDFFIPTGISANAVWKSSNEKVVTVDNSGMVMAVGAGKATITVTQGDVVLECPVTVKSAVSMTSKGSAKIAAGKTFKIKIEGNSGKVKYTSDNTKVATVDKKGTVTALKSGKTTIKAKVDGETFKVKITVTSSPKLASKTVTVKKGKTATVKVTGAASKPTVSKCNVATITPAKTKLTIKGKSKGTNKVTVTVNGVKLKLTVKVN